MFNLQQGRRAELHALWVVAFGGGPVVAVTCAWRANFGAGFFCKASAVGSQGRGVRWLRSRCVVVGNFFFLRFAFGTFFFCGCAAQVLGAEIFGNAFALRSVAIATQDAHDCGQLVGFAACLWNLFLPTWAVKILDAEIFARHRRHAAFRSRRGWPKIVVS